MLRRNTGMIKKVNLEFKATQCYVCDLNISSSSYRYLFKGSSCQKGYLISENVALGDVKLKTIC